MPARDFLHDAVRTALIKDGWTITDDPFTISFGIRRVYADMAAKRLLLAEKGAEHIVVEAKSFIGLSRMNELECALGQYLIYRSWLKRKYPKFMLYLALDQAAYFDLFSDISGEVIADDYDLKFIIIDAAAEEITQWEN